MIVAAFNNGNKTAAPSYPDVVGPGWTLLAEATGAVDVIGYNFGARTSARVWSKLATTADVGSYTKVDSDNTLSTGLAVYRAAADAPTAVAQVSTAQGVTLTAPAVAMPAPGFQTCFFGANAGDPGVITVLTAGGSLTQRAATGSTNTHKAASLVADAAVGQGAAGAKTATMDDPEGDWSWVAFSVAVIWGVPSAPPARLFPREDGLGVGGGRHFPPPKSQQRSNRRFGYY